jgi:DUF1680 family protein
MMSKSKHVVGIAIVFLAVMVSSLAFGAEMERDYPVKPVPFTDVRFTDEFWLPRMETNRTVTIPYAFKKCEETNRIRNFEIAGGLVEGEFEGIYFNDSDVFKIMEGAAYSLSLHPDPELERYLDELIAKVAAAQEDDGYLYTFRTIGPSRGGTDAPRWSELAHGHELYNVGHMYEAAVAHYQATGKRTFLDVALKNAELIDRVFGPGKKRIPPGHQEIEIGLVKLYRVTGDERYLNLAKFFLDVRGHEHDGRDLWGEYNQDHKPVIEQTEAVGHSVRAAYMYSGMADVAALTGDSNYAKAIDRIWDDIVSGKLYVTGGIGARGGGEAFGDGYQLPNLTAYCETCAAIANVFWNHRLFLMHGDAKYIDVMERTLYNGSISGISLKGDLFFYPNPLESFGTHSRSPWFGCACCPSNVTRFVASVPGYVYAHRDDTLYVNMFVGGSGTVKMTENTVRIDQETRYPWDGAVKMTVNPERPAEFAIHVRIPGWARNEPVPSDLYRYADKRDDAPGIKINGRAIGFPISQGFAQIRGPWKKGDVIELDLPMPVRRVLAHENVEDDRGKAALQRGPIVFCAEWPDNKDGRVRNLLVPDDAALKNDYREDMLEGVQVIHGPAYGVAYGDDGESLVKSEQDFLAIPYYAWAHRGTGEMAVWLARDESAAKPLAGSSIAFSSKLSVSAGVNAGAVKDQLEPKSSIDHAVPFFHWWPRKGTEEWVQYEFEEPAEVSSVEVYWFDDTGIGECRLPHSWRVVYKSGDEWIPVNTEDDYGVEKDKYNTVTFKTVETGALRLEIQGQENFAGGIHEWKVK